MTEAEPGIAPGADEELRADVEAVAAALNDRLAAITSSMRDLLSTRIEELGGDSALIDLLGSSIQGNVENILHALRHGIPVENIEPPSAAYEYARRLAQRGVPVNALVRAYRLGQQHVLDNAFIECVRQHPDPLRQAATLPSDRHGDVRLHRLDLPARRHRLRERARALADRAPDRARAVASQDLVSGATDDIDAAEAVIGYRLRVPHLGAVLWVHETGAQQDQLTRFNRVVTAVAEKLGSGRSPLVIPRDRASAWAWIPVADGFSLDLAAVRPLLDDDAGPPLPMIALGGRALRSRRLPPDASRGGPGAAGRHDPRRPDPSGDRVPRARPQRGRAAGARSRPDPAVGARDARRPGVRRRAARPPAGDACCSSSGTTAATPPRRKSWSCTRTR